MEVPSCLADAYKALSNGRAWVACLNHEEGVATVTSKATIAELLGGGPGQAQYLSPDCPKLDRVAFLIAGVLEVERRVFS